MNRLIRTPSRRIIQIIPQIDIQLLSRTDIPRRLIRTTNTRDAPLQIITSKRKRAIRVLRLGKRHREREVVDDACLGDDGIEQFDGRAGGGHELHELAVDDLELAGGCGVAEEGGAGRVERFGLDVFVEVGVGDGTDPVVAGLEGGAGPGTYGCGCRTSSCGRCSLCGCCGGFCYERC